MNKLSNPYNSLGRAHNDGLDYVGRNLPTNPTVLDLIDLTSAYILSCQFKQEYTAEAKMSMDVYIASIFNDEFSVTKLIQANKFSHGQLYYLDIILNPNPTINNADLPDFYLKIGYDIITTSLSMQEKQPLLIGAAVGNYSAIYWNEQINNQGSIWYPHINTIEARLPGWVKSDAAGAIGGALGAGLYAWWTGAGIVPAVICGALGGAVGNSLSSVF